LQQFCKSINFTLRLHSGQTKARLRYLLYLSSSGDFFLLMMCLFFLFVFVSASQFVTIIN